MRSKLTVTLLIVVLLASLAVAQQVKRARNATISAATMELDWENNIVQFSGGTKLTMTGDTNATMNAPSMTVHLTPKGDRVTTVAAKGPVEFTILTKADSAGQRRKIVATAQQEATYSDQTQLIKLVGQATASLLPLEGAEGVEAVQFTGQTITANLRTSKLSVDNANLSVKTEME